MSIAFTKIAYCTKLLLDFRADCPIPFAKFYFPGFSGAGLPFRGAVFSDSRPCRPCPSAATRHRYRAVPKGLTISDQPCAYWPSALPTAHCQRRQAIDTGRYPEAFRIQASRERIGCRPCRLRTVSGDTPSIPGVAQRSDNFRPAVCALAVGPADCALSAATRHRYRAVPKGLTISGQPWAHWQRHLAARRLPAFAGGLRWQSGR